MSALIGGRIDDPPVTLLAAVPAYTGLVPTVSPG